MKTRITSSLVLMASLLLSGAAYAEDQPIPGESIKVMSTRQVTLPVSINENNVKLSRADYAMPTVKVLVPELASETLMNHRNTAEGAPCLATEQTKDPQDVIQGKPAIEKSVFKIELVRTMYANEQEKVCEVMLTENVTTKIRGLVFSHSRSSTLPLRSLEDCK